MPDPPFVKDLLEAEDRAAAELEKEFLDSVSVTVKETDWKKLERDLLAHANHDEIVDGIQWEEYDPKKALSNLVEVALESHGKYIGSVTAGAKFDYVDPNALEWIKKYAADDVTLITKSQKEAIRKIILDGYETGITPQNQAKMIRENIGLDVNRSKTLTKYGENLFAKGMDEAEVWRLVEQKGRALLNQRALTIAINEASEAAGNATYQSTKSAIERGVIDANLWEGYRIVTADERTCPICNGVAGEARRPLPDGVYESSGAVIAKKHTKCRCVEGLREMTKKESNSIDITEVVFEAAPNTSIESGIIKKKTVPLVEGVFSGRGFPVLREYKEFAKDAHWLDGLPVVTNHEELTPGARKIAKLKEIELDPGRKRVKAISYFFEDSITPKERATILDGHPMHGSMQLWCERLDFTPGTWNGKPYKAREVGPYKWIEYSVVKQGVVTPADGAGFGLECNGCIAKERTPDYVDKLLELIKPLVDASQFDAIHKAARGYAGGKGKAASLLSQLQSPAPGGADMEIEEVKEMIAEAQKPLMERIATLEAENTTLKGDHIKITEGIEADRQGRVFEMFQSKLKPGHLSEAKELYESYQKDPGAWVLENADKFAPIKEEKKLTGSAMAGSASAVPGKDRPYTPEEMTAEQAKIHSKVVG